MYVIFGSFQQRRIFRIHGQVDQRFANHRLENGPCYSRMMNPGPDGQPSLSGIVELEAKAGLEAFVGIPTFMRQPANRNLDNIDVAIVGFDLAEVSPPYDSPGEITSILAANLAFEFLSLLALKKP